MGFSYSLTNESYIKVYLKAVPTIFTEPCADGEWADPIYRIQDAFDFSFQEYEHKFLLMKTANFDLWIKLLSYLWMQTLTFPTFNMPIRVVNFIVRLNLLQQIYLMMWRLW